MNPIVFIAVIPPRKKQDRIRYLKLELLKYKNKNAIDKFRKEKNIDSVSTVFVYPK